MNERTEYVSEDFSKQQRSRTGNYEAKLALSLFVLRILADNHYTAVSLDYLALVAHRLN